MDSQLFPRGRVRLFMLPPNSIANPRILATFAPMWLRGLALVPVLALFAGAGMVLSEDAPKAREQDKPPFPRNGAGGPPSGPGRGFGFGGGRKDAGMDRLSEEEKKRLRSAVEKVWNNTEVAAARERIMKANEDLRTTLRAALQKSDPDVVPILEKVKSPMPWEQHRNGPPLPRPEDPNFPRQAAARLGFELMAFAKPEQREAFRHLHEQVVELPEVKLAITKIQEAPPEGRMEAFKNLREVYKQACEKAIADYRRKRAAEGGKSENLAAPAK
ncbi:MAG: hypothetical protein JWO89_3423 [Verrucomicrobiaceae bacterium]|nr:hypothetical protein [Verrucomicrobiaceae bacterium]